MAKNRARLDKGRKYGQIFGIHEYGGVFEQDGKCFGADGLEVGPGITPEIEDPDRPGAAGPAPVEPVTTEPPPPEPPPAPTTDIEAQLKGLHASQVDKLVREAGETPHKGPGSKARNIELLLSLQG